MNSPIKLSCAVYLRKACTEDDDVSYDTKKLGELFLAGCEKRFGDEVDFTLYHDHGFSGMHTERPALQRLMQDVAAHKIHVVAFPGQHHLSRNSDDSAMLARFFASYSVKMIDVSARMAI